MVRRFKSGLDMVKGMFEGFLSHEAPRMAAALAYYTAFALPPMLILRSTLVRHSQRCG